MILFEMNKDNFQWKLLQIYNSKDVIKNKIQNEELNEDFFLSLKPQII